MSHKSRSIVASMVSGVVILIAYAVYASTKDTQGPEAVETWALRMLVFLGITVVVLMAVQTVFRVALAVRIAAEEGAGDSGRIERILAVTMAEDEMGQMISLRSARVGYVCAGIGFVGALVALAAGGSAVLALHLLFGAFAAGSLIAGAVSVYGYGYGRGVRNG